MWLPVETCGAIAVNCVLTLRISRPALSTSMSIPASRDPLGAGTDRVLTDGWVAQARRGAGR